VKSGQTRPANAQTFRNQTLRLVVHTSAAGKKLRIRLSNTYGEQPLVIGSAHVARRTAAADIDHESDRVLLFRGRSSTTVPARSVVVSDPIDLEVPALSDLSVSLFFPDTVVATTSHILALQTSYVSPEPGDFTAEVKFPVAKTLVSWPFLTGVDVAASARGAAIVAFGSSRRQPKSLPARTSSPAIASSSRRPTRRAFASWARRFHHSRARRSSAPGSTSVFTPPTEKNRVKRSTTEYGTVANSMAWSGREASTRRRSSG